MSNQTDNHTLGFFQTLEQTCAYLPDRQSATLLADPDWPMDAHAYSTLLAHGFRRSGEHVYRPACPSCNACVPIRIEPSVFRASRNQRRTLAANHDVEHRWVPASDDPETVQLYQRYLRSRHPDSDMANADTAAFRQFLISSWCNTLFLEMRLAGRLIAVAVTDQVPDALSAVYTFFEPELAKRSLGRLAILRQLEVAATHQIKWLYLGYAIEACQNMAYKADYRPQQQFLSGAWQERI